MRKTKVTRSQFEEIVLDVCQDRGFCNDYRISYNHLDSRDLYKVRSILKKHYTIVRFPFQLKGGK